MSAEQIVVDMDRIRRIVETCDDPVLAQEMITNIVLALPAVRLAFARSEAEQAELDRLRSEMAEARQVVLHSAAEIARMGWAGDEVGDASHERLLVHVHALKRAFDILVRPEAERQELARRERLGVEQVPVKPPDIEAGSCDWGHCDNEGVTHRWTSAHGWLPVCIDHLTGDPVTIAAPYRKVAHDDGKATQLWMIVKDEGWRESILCQGMYERDANLLLAALARSEAEQAVIDASIGWYQDDRGGNDNETLLTMAIARLRLARREGGGYPTVPASSTANALRLAATRHKLYSGTVDDLMLRAADEIDALRAVGAASPIPEPPHPDARLQRPKTRTDLAERIAQRRSDPEFRARLDRLTTDNQELLKKLEEH